MTGKSGNIYDLGSTRGGQGEGERRPVKAAGGERVFAVFWQERKHRAPAGPRPLARREQAARSRRCWNRTRPRGWSTGRASQGRRGAGGPSHQHSTGGLARTGGPGGQRLDRGVRGPRWRADSHLQRGHGAGEEILAVLQLLEVGGPRLGQRRGLPFRRHLPHQRGRPPRGHVTAAPPPPPRDWRGLGGGGSAHSPQGRGWRCGGVLWPGHGGRGAARCSWSVPAELRRVPRRQRPRVSVFWAPPRVAGR